LRTSGPGPAATRWAASGFETVDVSGGAAQVMTNLQRAYRGPPRPVRPVATSPTIPFAAHERHRPGRYLGLDKFLVHTRTLLAPGGRSWLFHSGVPRNLTDEGPLRINLNGQYYGEVQYSVMRLQRPNQRHLPGFS
jgi:hypothetical protein